MGVELIDRRRSLQRLLREQVHPGQMDSRPDYPAFAFSPAASIPATAQTSSLSEVSPEMPTAPSTLPDASLISTPPGTGTRRPWETVASTPKNSGFLPARSASSREPKPMPSAPHAFPYAMSKRRMPDLSSRLNA